MKNDMDMQRIGGSRIRIGTFIKTGSPQVVELLGLTKLDFAVIDAEHAPFDRNLMDLMLLAGRAANLPLLVRVADKSATSILQALDLGAQGILVPHVDSADDARAVVARARYRGGERGYSGSQRSSGYGTQGMKASLDAGDRTVVICQIESVAGLNACAEIAAVPGVAGLFVGRADLALAMGLEDSRAPAVLDATRRILQVARAAGRIPGMAAASAAEARGFIADGASWFIVSSDQGLLRDAAQSVATSLAADPAGMQP